MNFASFFRSLIRLFLFTILVAVLAISGFQPSESALAVGCTYLNDIEGDYQCHGQCVLKGTSGLEFLDVSGETDTIKYLTIDNQNLTENNEDFYEVRIEGGDGFEEVEIGPLTGLTMQTATTEVSDYTFPVVEQYLFDANASEDCKATGFTKIVSNPTEENFKSCVIHCSKN